MNIKEAKQEVLNTVRAYLAKDDMGNYEIPIERQRPVLLMGPPGVGKTAIMEQVARECGINLVSYTITHHTRQSAIGLPFIETCKYGDLEENVTKYTMSEIIASVYEAIENSGVAEGILFLDEINCVSETLAPTMLQFLQYKTFGNHKVPDGFVIVTAGNPPEYNKSVRDFDIVTYDRVKRIFIEADYSVWKEYAYKARIHGSIIAYLEIKKNHFYSVVSDVEGKRFVTARGWEDLSAAMKTYEKLGIPVNYDFISQYVQDLEIAEDFAAYYELYNKYQHVYRVPEILDGKVGQAPELKDAPFDEKLSLIGLLVDRLGENFANYANWLSVQKEFMTELTYLRDDLKAGRGDGVSILNRLEESYSLITKKRQKSGLLDREEENVRLRVAKLLKKSADLLTWKGTGQAKEDFGIVKTYFDDREKERLHARQQTDVYLSNALEFLARTFGEGQELVIFLTELSSGYYSMNYIRECGNDTYYKYNRLLLLRDAGNETRSEALELLHMN